MQHDRLAAHSAPPWRIGPTAPWMAAASVLAAALILLGFQISLPGPPYTDDAYYYFLIARNIVEHGVSSFDGQTLTNGYHPLWLLLLVLQYGLIGSFGLIPSCLEFVLVLAGLFLLLRARDSARFLDNWTITLAYVSALLVSTLNGMEIALFSFLQAGLVYGLARFDPARKTGALSIGLLGAAAIGARIDAAVFVLPLIGLGLSGWRARVTAFAPIALFGALYLGLNQALFGMALPVSGAVKALGGLQINHAFLRGLADGLGGISQDRPFDQLIGLVIVAAGLYAFAKPRGFERTLLLVFILGMIAYGLKLVLFSSWRSWSWYCYPALFGFYAVLRAGLTAADRLTPVAARRIVRIALAASVSVSVLGPLLRLMASTVPTNLGFITFNAVAADAFAPILKGQRVAMGDRAGSFAVAYDGPVTQLEGLVNDAEYYRMLAQGGDLKALLCRRGVKFIADYEVDLGAYDTHRIAILRPCLTDFKGPSLTVRKEDEAARFADPARFDNSAFDEGDSMLYLWRLSGCP